MGCDHVGEEIDDHDVDDLGFDHDDDVDDYREDDYVDDDGLIALHLLLNVVVNETADVREDIRNLTMLMIRTAMTKIMMKMKIIMKMKIMIARLISVWLTSGILNSMLMKSSAMAKS